MRIIGGEWRGRRLSAPKGMTSRPTTDRVRESLFNLLAHRDGFSFDGARVIDLFAGSGALGFEALSRGAAFALFVETNAAARGAIRETIEAFGQFGRTRIHRRDALALGEKPAGLGAPFDLAFLDPPYRKGLAPPALEALAKGGWLSPAALAVVETASDEPTSAAPGFDADDVRVYGDTRIEILVRSSANA
ncbi:MAG: 16S rRNA (guanine(966)-N(2))-methyltransferase RsmD [Pseudomonadota bacterium]